MRKRFRAAVNDPWVHVGYVQAGICLLVPAGPAAVAAAFLAGSYIAITMHGVWHFAVTEQRKLSGETA